VATAFATFFYVTTWAMAGTFYDEVPEENKQAYYPYSVENVSSGVGIPNMMSLLIDFTNTTSAVILLLLMTLQALV